MKHLKTLLPILLCIATFQLTSQTRYYASNRVLNAVNTYQSDGTYIEEFVEQNSGGISNPQDIIYHPEGFLLITATNNTQIKKFDVETGEYLGDWSDENFNLSNPSKMSIGPDNLIYVTQWGTTQSTSKIVRFDLDGNYLGPFTPSAPQGLGHVWDEQGNFYLALFGLSTGSGTIRKYDPDGNFIEIFIDSAVLENPTYIWWDHNGDMLVQDFTAGKVLRYSNTGDYIDEFITGLLNPEGYTYLPNNHLLISERGANQITEFDASGNLIGPWSNGGTLAGPNFIEAIDIPDLSISEISIPQLMVTPTVGISFHFLEIETQNIDQINVYNLMGTLVTSFDPKNIQQWDASMYPEGTYLLNAIKFNGTTMTQKIMIKR